MANTLAAPATMIAPLVGGWLADTQGYQATFLFAAVAGFLSVLIYHFFVKDPEKCGGVPMQEELDLKGTETA
jgi:fructose-specific phosphotransferase system IIC component